MSVLCIFCEHFVDEGTALVMNSKSIDLQMRASRHKTQRCVHPVCVSLDKAFMTEELWNKENDTREFVCVRICKQQDRTSRHQ